LVKWVYQFLGRHGFSIWHVTYVGQKLMGHLDKVWEDAAAAVRQHFEEGSTLFAVQPRHFINMDQCMVLLRVGQK